MEKVTVIIDGKSLQVPANFTVLQAAREANINIPTLCYLEGINEIGACRMCLVEVKGGKALQASCVYPVTEGMEVFTNTSKVRVARKANLELILSNHDRKCLTCVRSHNCELQSLAKDLNITEISFEGENIDHPIDDFSASIVRDNNKCVLCRRCVAVCKNIQKTAVIQAKNRGFKTEIGSVFDRSLNDVACINCGQCITACPVGALREKDGIERVWKALSNKDLHVVVQTAPAVRAGLGEEFGMEMGTPVEGKMVAALKLMGFSRVFDTNTGADFTIMEEGYELMNRIKNGGTLPMITSCSPGWVKYCEHHFPDFLDNLSSCKSPHMMLGALLKSVYAKNENVDPKKMYVVSVMPCTAKKFEIERPEMECDGLRDVDAVITTRELARMIKEAGIDFANLEDAPFDNPMGAASGAGAIFGASGGVMEAALRTVAEVMTGKRLDDVNIMSVRGEDGIKEFEVPLPNLLVKGAVVSSTGKAKELLESIQRGEKEYHFIEVMGCPGGCIVGGGQPIVSSQMRSKVNVWEKRAKALYKIDEASVVRRSHENPYVQAIYKEHLGEPNGHTAHHLFHTHYTERIVNPENLANSKTVEDARSK